jgi:hypothetical protein
MFLDIIAYVIIGGIVATALILLILFIVLVIADYEPKRAWPLVGFALLLGGFVWALFRLGVM